MRLTKFQLADIDLTSTRARNQVVNHRIGECGDCGQRTEVGTWVRWYYSKSEQGWVSRGDTVCKECLSEKHGQTV